MNNLNILIDCSGSMKEWGKDELIKSFINLFHRYSNSLDFQNYKFNFYYWNEKVEKFDDNKYSLEGKSNLKALLVFLENNNDKNILLSDGNFEITIPLKQKNYSLICVCIGSDSNPLTLKKLSSTNFAYSADKILYALKNICFGGV